MGTFLARLALDPRARRIAIAVLAVTLALIAAVVMIAVSMTSAYSTAAQSSAGGTCTSAQPPASSQAQNSIPAPYLAQFRAAGATYGVPWVVLAGIGKVETDDGRTSLPGVHSGANAFGAAGPMQIGIGGAAGNTWGGAPVHPAAEHVAGIATDGDGDGIASVYDPADAIAGAARYLVAHGVRTSVPQAIFAYNHLQSYVQQVLSYAGRYARGGYTVTRVTLTSTGSCLTAIGRTPTAAVARVIAFAERQLGKPYLWGGTGPDAFDCSGLVMMAYRTAGIDIPRTSQAQWLWGPRIPASQAQPGDLVFFAGSDGTTTHPGHVGLVIGGGKMIEAWATGFPIRVAPYGGRNPIGFTRPWLRRGVSGRPGGAA
jgi:cell wall-associated NlpC family hydrolase